MNEPAPEHVIARLQIDLGNPGVDGDEVIRRGGANCGNEDFVLCKCPHCSRVYLAELEVETLYTDAADLSRRIPLWANSNWECAGCNCPFPENAKLSRDSPPEMQVSWRDLATSPWRWVTRETRTE